MALTCMGARLAFPVTVVVGLVLLTAMTVAEHQAPDRLRARAAAAGHATTQLAIREMG